MKHMMTTDQVLTQADMKHRTLMSWVQQGLLPKPLMVAKPTGRGRHGVWPSWVMERIFRIQEMKERGLLLSQIASALWRDDRQETYQRFWVKANHIISEWFSAKRTPNAQQWGRVVDGRPLMEHVHEAIDQDLQRHDISEERRRVIVDRITSHNCLVHALVVWLAGMEPVAIVTETGCAIVPRQHQPVASSAIHVPLLPVLRWAWETDPAHEDVPPPAVKFEVLSDVVDHESRLRYDCAFTSKLGDLPRMCFQSSSGVVPELAEPIYLDI